MHILATIILFTIASQGTANAFEGKEYDMMQAVGRSFFNETCEPARALMGNDTFFQGHYERCLGMLAVGRMNKAKEANDNDAARRHRLASCQHYGRAIALWQQKPLPSGGTKKDVDARRGMLDSLIAIQKEDCSPVDPNASVAGKTLCFPDGGKATFVASGQYKYEGGTGASEGTWMERGSLVCIAFHNGGSRCDLVNLGQGQLISGGGKGEKFAARAC